MFGCTGWCTVTTQLSGTGCSFLLYGSSFLCDFCSTLLASVKDSSAGRLGEEFLNVADPHPEYLLLTCMLCDRCVKSKFYRYEIKTEGLGSDGLGHNKL